MVRRLKAAGAVLIGKLAMVELAGGAAAAVVAAYGWDWAWKQRERRIAIPLGARLLAPRRGS